MYTIEDLKNIQEPVKIENLRLKIYAEFFEKYLSNRRYFIELENDEVLTFTIKNKHFPHLIALHKFYDPTNENFKLHRHNELKKDKGFRNIYNEHIKIEDLLSVYSGSGRKRKRIFNNFKKRILGFPFTYQMLRKSAFFVYKKENVTRETSINGNYLFAIDIYDTKYHFFFINDSKVIDDNYVPITFVTTRKEDFNFFNPNDMFKVKKIKIQHLLNGIEEEFLFENIEFESWEEVASTLQENEDQ